MFPVEIPTGTINGTNNVFTSSGTVRLISLNGLTIPPEDTIYGFTNSGTIFTMDTPPSSGDVLLVYYEE